MRGEEGKVVGAPCLERFDLVAHEVSEEVTMLEPADQLGLFEEGSHHLVGRSPQEIGIAG